MIKKTGFTLLEILIAVSICGLLAAAVFEIISLGKKSWDTGSEKQTLDNQLRIGIDNMARELYNSQGGKITIVDDPDRAGSKIITFSVPIGSNATGLVWGADNKSSFFIRYVIDNNNRLMRQILNSAGVLLPNDPGTKIYASNIDSIQWDFLSGYLAVNISAADKNLRSNLSTELTLRN